MSPAISGVPSRRVSGTAPRPETLILTRSVLVWATRTSSEVPWRGVGRPGTGVTTTWLRTAEPSKQNVQSLFWIEAGIVGSFASTVAAPA